MNKYLLVLSSMELGGAERQAVSFASFLIQHGKQAEIIGLSSQGIVSEICEKKGIPCYCLDNNHKFWTRVLSIINKAAYRLGFPLMPEGYLLADYMKQGKYDVCISYCTLANTILGLSKVFYKKSFCVWFQRDAGIFDKTDGYQAFAIKKFDMILANSRSGQKWLKTAYGTDAAVIPNGVSLEYPKIDAYKWRSILRVSEKDTVYTMVANLSSAKDHMSLLRAWKLLLDQNEAEGKVLVLAGRFDQKYPELKEYVQTAGLTDYVRFLGKVDDISGLFEVTDICVFSAISEGSPNGVIEAEMSGLPVIATDLAEIREIVSEENRKFLFEKDDMECIAEYVKRFERDSGLRKKLGRENKKFVQEMFSPEKNFSEIISVIENSEFAGEKSVK